jgi:very-short-patch-repair endonuclease
MADARMETVAARQHGLVTRAQAEQAGLTRSAIEHRLRSADWHRIARGVFRLAGAVETPHQRALAAVFAAGDAALLSHQSAAALLGLPGFQLEPITVSIHRTRRRVPGVRVEQSCALLAQHRRVVDGIPCTSVARTLFDLCGHVYALRAERALDTALARRLVTLPALWRMLDELAEHGRNGTVLMRTLLTERGASFVPPASELEARFLQLVDDSRLPRPEQQVDLGDADQWIGRVDFVWKQSRVVAEVDGAAFHDGLIDRREDQTRDARLRREGWTVLRFRWVDVTTRPSHVVQALRAAIEQAA